MAKYFTPSIDVDINNNKQEIERTYIEHYVITILMNNVREKGPYQLIKEDYKYHKDEISSELQLAIEISAAEESNSKETSSKRNKKRGGKSD